MNKDITVSKIQFEIEYIYLNIQFSISRVSAMKILENTNVVYKENKIWAIKKTKKNNKKHMFFPTQFN